MPRVELTLLAAQIRRIASEEALTDAELAGRYAEHRDAAAFEVLVWRHGPMAFGIAVCRQAYIYPFLVVFTWLDRRGVGTYAIW
jgi:hypothetical protein